MLDILLGDTFDLAFDGGDFVTGESTRQHQQLLLLVEKGELKEFPSRGVGIASWLLDDATGNLNGQIKREYEADGMKVLKIAGSGQTFNVEAIYES
ncbi:MAG: hypothetical protein JNM22_01830 [Saprospiraceae bacterium]|nr:hypothetical protein [Saprospiraceae bacterium]